MHSHVSHSHSRHAHARRIDVSWILAVRGNTVAHGVVVLGDDQIHTPIVEMTNSRRDATGCVGSPDRGSVLEGGVIFCRHLRIPTAGDIQPDWSHFIERAGQTGKIFVGDGDDGCLVLHGCVHEFCQKCNFVR